MDWQNIYNTIYAHLIENRFLLIEGLGGIALFLTGDDSISTDNLY